MKSGTHAPEAPASSGKNGKSCRISSRVGWRPYSQTSKASALFTRAAFSAPYHSARRERNRSAVAAKCAPQ